LLIILILLFGMTVEPDSAARHAPLHYWTHTWYAAGL